MIFNQIKTDQLQFRKEKDSVRSKVLTTLIGELQTTAINSGTKEISDTMCLEKIKKFMDANKEMQAIKFTEDLVIEAEVLTKYLPQQLSEDELTAVIVNFITDEGLEKSPKNIGKVMGYLKKSYPSKYDGEIASSIVKEYLS